MSERGRGCPVRHAPPVRVLRFVRLFRVVRPALVCTALLTASAVAADDEPIVKQEAKHLFHSVPDAELSLADGPRVRLSELWSDKPLLVTLFYQRCTGSCSPFLRSLGAAIDRVGGLGDDYRVVSLSIDPEDTAERVGELADALQIGKPGAWFVGVAPPAEVAAVADAVGFWYQRIPDTKQFDHPSLVAAVRDGRIVRVLLGNQVSVPRFRELVMELKGTHVPFYLDPEADTPFRCLDVDEETGTLTLGWGLLVLLVPGLASALVAVGLFRGSRTHG